MYILALGKVKTAVGKQNCSVIDIPKLTFCNPNLLKLTKVLKEFWKRKTGDTSVREQK